MEESDDDFESESKNLTFNQFVFFNKETNIFYIHITKGNGSTSSTILSTLLCVFYYSKRKLIVH